MTVIVSVLIVYLIVLLVLGAWGSKSSGSVAGYYVAEKQLPSWVIAFSSTSTGESAWLLLGLTGMGYAVGVHAFWVILGEFLGVLATGTRTTRARARIKISIHPERIGPETTSRDERQEGYQGARPHH